MVNQIVANIDKTPVASPQRQIKASDEFGNGNVANVQAKTVVAKSEDVDTSTDFDQKQDASGRDNVFQKESGSVSIDKLEKAISKVEATSGFSNSKISYEVDNVTDKLVVKIVDKDTDEIIRQLPPKEMLSLAAKLEEVKGFILNEEG